jgi:hypothetical protein
MSWDRPSPLPHDTIQHESITWDNEEPIPRPRQHPDGQPHERPFRHEVHSQASDLDSPIYHAGELDDQVHLTSQNTVWRRSAPYERDLERRRAARGDRNRGDQRTGALKAMSKSIRRASVRVVNFAGKNMDDRPVKLDDVDEYPDSTLNTGQEQPVPLLRGKTLGIFGPKNPIRIFMHKLLSSPFVSSPTRITMDHRGLADFFPIVSQKQSYYYLLLPMLSSLPFNLFDKFSSKFNRVQVTSTHGKTLFY